MKTEKKYTEQLTQLIKSLSDFTGQELEEAKEIIRAAGKDPDIILEEARVKLAEIRANVKKSGTRLRGERETESNDVLSAFPVLKYDTDTATVKLSEERISSEVLKAEEVYSSFIKKYPLRTHSLKQITLDENIRKMKFLRIAAQLMFEINLTPDNVSVKPLLHGVITNFYLDPEQVRTAVQIGYFVFRLGVSRHYWMPIDKESIDHSREILEVIDEKGGITLNKALWYYHRRAEYRYLRFREESLNMNLILDSSKFAASSSLFIRELYDYQKQGLRWLSYCCINRLGGVLADDMGLGKTAQIIALISWLIEKNVLERMLIIVPGTLIENWRREFEFFAPEIIPYIHHGANRTGSPTEILNHNIVITSYSMIINDLYLLNKINWGLTVCDEASLIKNPDSERRHALNAITSEVRIAMTGTPVENSLIDLWSIADYVNPGYLSSREEFSKRYIRKDIESTLAESDLHLLKNYISFIMLRRRREDVLDSLPERIDIHQALEMSEEEAILYDEQRKNILSHFSEQNGISALREILELRQFTTHPYLIQANIVQPSISDLCKTSVKFSRTIELLDEIKERNEKALVFTEYLGMIDILQDLLSKHYGINVLTIDGRVHMEHRQQNIDVFSEISGFSVMVLNPRTAGMGLNITAANHVIHYTRQWNPALEEQASARSYRNGQKKGVNIYYLFYINTIEEVIDNRLKAKKSLFGEVIVATQDTVTHNEFFEILNKSPLNNKK